MGYNIARDASPRWLVVKRGYFMTADRKEATEWKTLAKARQAMTILGNTKAQALNGIDPGSLYIADAAGRKAMKGAPGKKAPAAGCAGEGPGADEVVEALAAFSRFLAGCGEDGLERAAKELNARQSAADRKITDCLHFIENGEEAQGIDADLLVEALREARKERRAAKNALNILLEASRDGAGKALLEAASRVDAAARRQDGWTYAPRVPGWLYR